MKTKIVVASHNQGKVKEIKNLLILKRNLEIKLQK